MPKLPLVLMLLSAGCAPSFKQTRTTTTLPDGRTIEQVETSYTPPMVSSGWSYGSSYYYRPAYSWGYSYGVTYPHAYPYYSYPPHAPPSRIWNVGQVPQRIPGTPRSSGGNYRPKKP